MGWKAQLKALQAAERRQQREAQKRLRELELQAKEQAKLSALEQARLEVETFESTLDVLLSVHKERGEVWNWREFATALPPHMPQRFARHEFKTKQAGKMDEIEQAQAQDERDFQEALAAHTAERAEWERMRIIARRIIAGEPEAYGEALIEFSGLAEISNLGSSVSFKLHNGKLLECRLKVNGQQAIPSELKTLTSTGRVSVKAMPKSRLHEIYQDYVCACVLRVGREVLALLPVETALVTASADVLDSRTGHMAEQTVLSVALPRIELERLNFEQIDPSDAIEGFLHRGDAKASRKSGEFERIEPLTPADLSQAAPENLDFRDLLATMRRVRDELKAELQKASPQGSVDESRFAQES